MQIPDDARVYVEYGKYKTNKFVLHERIRIGHINQSELHNMYEKFTTYMSSNNSLELVKFNGLALEHVKNQTPDICLAAVKQNCHAIEYVNPELRI